jgi:hypothetical protein
MNILFTGKGSSGSWDIRGNQLGRAMGGTVLPRALDVGGFDVAVLVKRPQADLLARLHRMAVPIVWDVVDAWPQPAGNLWERDQAMAWLRETFAQIHPRAIVAATERMAWDCADFGVPILAVPHHANPSYTVVPNRIRDRVGVVGYEGSLAHLGRWSEFLHHQCRRRGWRFLPQQSCHPGLFDIVVALRELNGYAPRHWKSNVKLANAQGTGTPFIGNRECGYLETACGAERWADTEQELIEALDSLEPYEARLRAHQELLEAAPHIGPIAHRYLRWIETL